jgi:hypothetical protein
MVAAPGFFWSPKYFVPTYAICRVRAREFKLNANNACVLPTSLLSLCPLSLSPSLPPSLPPSLSSRGYLRTWRSLACEVCAIDTWSMQADPHCAEQLANVHVHVHHAHHYTIIPGWQSFASGSCLLQHSLAPLRRLPQHRVYLPAQLQFHCCPACPCPAYHLEDGPCVPLFL